MKMPYPKLTGSHFHWLFVGLTLLTGIVFGAPAVSQETAMELMVVPNHQSVMVQTIEAETYPVGDQLVRTKLKCGSQDIWVSARDQIWLVSARNFESTPCDVSQLEVCQLKNGQWEKQSFDNLVSEHSTDVARQTMVFVHGNLYDLEWCTSRGLQFYDSACNSGFERPPIRMILFSWKSERELFRPLQDFKIKTKRSLSLAPTFSRFLSELKDCNVLVCSYSLGAQIVVKALEQPCMKDCGYETYRYAMLAPAFDPGYACSSLESFANNSLVSQTEVFVNRDDRVIRASEFVAKKRCRKSIATLESLASRSQGCGNLITINDITDEVKASHLLSNYAVSPTLQYRLSVMLNQLNHSNSGLPVEMPIGSVLVEPFMVASPMIEPSMVETSPMVEPINSEAFPNGISWNEIIEVTPSLSLPVVEANEALIAPAGK